jgi:chemosensory pili system protein ChpA (sensor histidine kinase/response regulator)
MSTAIPQASLQLVSDELAVTLSDVRVVLEQYAEGEGGPQALERVATLLHTVRGVLRMTETHGASLLAEEMEQTCLHLAKLRRRDGAEEPIEALMRAAVQLPAYVERVLNGGRDIPLVLLPLLNDLRAARGRPLLSESTLLLLNVGGGPQLKSAPAERTGTGEDLARLCQELRPRFQLALLGLIRGDDAGTCLRQMSTAAERLERAAAAPELHQLWWVAAAVLEALIDNGLEISVSVKRLMGQADREIKRLRTLGEEAYARVPPTELVNNLLYYVSRARSNGARVTGVRAAFNLSDLIPGDAQVEQARRSLSAPSIKLMQTVAGAIREDLARVKDVLDIFVRTGMQRVEELTPQLELLKKIGDTLGVLGLGELREIVQTRRQQLQEMIADGRRPDESSLVGIAAALLNAEDRLEAELIGMIAPAADESTVVAANLPAAAGPDQQELTRAVMRECLVNLARVKDAITQVIDRKGDGATLDAIPELLRGITAGLLMLDKERVVGIISELQRAIRGLVQQGYEPADRAALDRLAEATVSLEYYLETLQAGRSEPHYMLDNAERCLEGLVVGAEGPAPEAEELAPPPVAPPAPLVVAPPPAPAPPVVFATTTDRLDPELLELFIEEAREEISAVQRCFPAWEHDETDADALIGLRRSFHTLKGSGRMVGAQRIGEFCWRVEALLNRLISRTLPRTSGVLDCLRDCIAALPELLEELETGAAPRDDLDRLLSRARELADADVVALPDTDAAEPAASVHVTQPDEEPASAAPTGAIDPVLLEILAREVTGHLDTLRRFLAVCEQTSAPYAVSEDVHRASHTLHGNMAMARVETGLAVAEALNHLIDIAFKRPARLSADALRDVGESVVCIEAVMAHLANPREPAPPTDELTWRLRAHAVGLEQETQPAIEVTTEVPMAELSADELPEAPQAPITKVEIVAEIEPEPAAVAPAIEAPPTPTPAAPLPFDAEIAAIFADEAAELLEAADAAATRAGAVGQGSQAVADLQRYLHTLKGGARMAGLPVMGDFSHELETLLIRASEGQIPRDAGFLELLRISLDELHRLREDVLAGVLTPLTPAVVARVRSALRSAPAAPLAVEPAVTEPAAPASPVAAAPPEGAEEPVPVAAADIGALRPSLDRIGELARELEQPAPRPAPTAPAEPWPAAAGRAVPERRETARVDSILLDQLLNNAGEISIFQSRLSQQLNQIQFNLEELGQTVSRLREQMRKLELETEAQILHRHQETSAKHPEFDPLELDRYSTIQQLTRGLAESASDVASLKDLLQNMTRDTEALLTQQSRTSTELQDGLMRTRMVPFQSHMARLARLVRQTAMETGKHAELQLRGSGELDRQVLERMLPPFEHMLRNAVVHGVEAPAVREAAGKSAVGQIAISLHRDGSEAVIELSDDGRGLDVRAIRRKAADLGMETGAQVSDEEAMQYILRPGFSTADRLTQAAGRGIGMDVVASEVAKLGGTLRIHSTSGRGTTFNIRLPFTLAVTQALIVRAANELYALPLPTVEGIIRLSRGELLARLATPGATIDYGDHTYQLRHLGEYVGLGPARLPEEQTRISIILVRAGNQSVALITDEMQDSREIVVKPVGPQLATIRGIAGATILGDGRIAVILDMGILVRAARPVAAAPKLPEPEPAPQAPLALVVDDSITMRRVTQRLLERNGMQVVTAKDGLEAIGVLQDHRPDIILLDIEMPRMDGFEFAKHVRNNPATAALPIIMITSRVSDKHRARAIEVGVNDYLGKPYQERDLLQAVSHLLRKS